MSANPNEPSPVRTFTYRALIIGITAMIALAIWVHMHEIVLSDGVPVAENSPPSAAVGIFMGVLMIGGIVALIRSKLRLTQGELVVIYTMLVVAAPLMSQGMWHRFLGFVVAIPHNRGNMVLVDSYSDKLWPHGEQLLDGRFESGMGGVIVDDGAAGEVTIVDVAKSQVGETKGLRITHPAVDNAEDDAVTVVRLRVNRNSDDGEAQLEPAERYYFSALFKTQDTTARTRLSVDLEPDEGETLTLLDLQRDTVEKYSQPGGFKRDGQPYVEIPRDMTEYADLVFTFQGPGSLTIADVVFFSNEALYRLHKGSTEIEASKLADLPENQREGLLVRPDNLKTPGGLLYVIKGYVPYDQWVTPLLYWTSIVMAIFMCLLGISVIFRKQWADNERFTFPLVVLPRSLIEQKDHEGRLIQPIVRKTAFWVGISVALVYCLMNGLAYYAGLPNPAESIVMHYNPNDKLAEYPAIKAFFNGFASNEYKVLLTFVAIAFFIDIEILASILIFFFITNLPYAGGELFGWKLISGPQDKFPFAQEQHIGAFLALALMVIWVSRKHLRGVFRKALGMADGVDDSREAMSYRTALILIIGSFIFFGVWGAMTGLGAGSSLIFFGFLVVCGLSASRIRTEVGAPATYFTPYFPYLIFYLLGGLDVFGTQTLLLAYCAGGFMAVAQFLMFAPSQVEMLHLTNEVNAQPRGTKWALIIGALGGVLLGGYVMLVWYYGIGADNISFTWPIRQDWYLGTLRNNVAVADKQSLILAANPSAEVGDGVPVPAVSAVGVGAVVTIVLMVMRSIFTGFWLHPIGYILANTYFIYGAWGSILVALCIKWVSLKVAGPRFIREQCTPFFVGIFVGCVAGIAMWDIVGLVLRANGAQSVFTAWP